MKRASVVLGLCSLWILVNCCHTFNQPVGMDVTFYAVLGQQLLKGARLYSQAWDHKPPFIYMTYALAQSIVGNGMAQFFLMGLVAALGTLGGVFLAGFWGTGRRSAGLWAAAFWAAAANDLWLEANKPNTEVFQNLFAVWAFAFLLHPKHRRGMRSAVAAGVLFAIASLYKHVMVVVPACLAIADWLSVEQEGPARLDFFRRWAIILAAGVALWGMTFTYFGATARSAEFFRWVFRFNQEYAMSNRFGHGHLFLNLTSALNPWHWKENVPDGALNVFIPGLIVMAAGLMLAGPTISRAPWIYWTAYAIGTFIAFALPGRLYGHYFQLWLPPLAIGAGWVLSLWTSAPARSRHWSPFVFGGIALGLLIVHESQALMLTPDQCSEAVWGNLFIADRQMGRQIETWLLPNESFYQWGHETGLYFYSHRSPASGVLDISPLYMGPSGQDFRRRVLQDLERSRPELVVICRWIRPVPGDEVFAWLAERYRPFPGSNFGSYLFLARTGGSLEARLAAAHHDRRT